MLLGILVAACTNLAQNKPSGDKSAVSGAASPQAVIAPTPTQQNAADKNDPIEIGKLNDKLDLLKSYRAKWDIQWKGNNKDLQPVEGNISFSKEYISATKDMHIRWESFKNGKVDKRFEGFSIKPDSYSYFPDRIGAEKCIARNNQNAQDLSVAEPWQYFGALGFAKPIKTGELVNGILADHYQIAAGDTGFPNLVSGSGDVWIAQDGKYVIKYVGKFAGDGGAISAEMRSGDISWSYELTDINKVSTVSLPPAECKKAGASLPIPEQATNVSSIQDMTLFRVQMDFAAITDFYKTKLLALGYKLTFEKSSNDTAGLTFQKDDKKVSILLARKFDYTEVTLQETK